MVKNPNISIVIPSFNQGEYIERTILSILKQEYRGKVEVIVSDGGSTDKTKDILKNYDNHITWWSEKDSGYAEAVNKGFKRATGEIFAIQSSDDYYLKNAFQNIAESFSENPDSALICGREKLLYPDGNIISGYLLPPVITPRGILMDHPFPGIFQHTTFFKREYFEKTNGLRSQFDMCADTDLFYRILHFNNGYFLDKYIAIYQRHNLQRTYTQPLKFENQLLEMVLNCKMDPYYNKLYFISDEDYLLFRTFVNLFYLQYANPVKAQIKAREIADYVITDERTKNLVQQLIHSEVIGRRQPNFRFINKPLRILDHLFKKYITRDKSYLLKQNKVSLSDATDADWWKV